MGPAVPPPDFGELSRAAPVVVQALRSSGAVIRKLLEYEQLSRRRFPAVLPASSTEAIPWHAAVYLASVNIGVKPFAGPARPGNGFGFSD